MFDQKPTNPEDIFSDTEPAANGANIVTQGASTQPLPPLTSRASFFAGKMLWIIFGAVILVVLVGGGLYLALRGGEDAPMAATPTPAVPEIPALTLPTPSGVGTPTPTTESSGGVGATIPNIDTDRDGISDADEASYGTNPTNPDTDGDELSDADEVRVYRTNPLAPDSDGDTYKDGQEVKGGYDPNGPGKLQDINRFRTP